MANYGSQHFLSNSPCISGGKFEILNALETTLIALDARLFAIPPCPPTARPDS